MITRDREMGDTSFNDQVNHAEGGELLAIDEQRRVLHACLLRYAADVGKLRERALDRVVLVGLVGSSDARPFKVGEIMANLRVALRAETVNDSLARLVADGSVCRTSVRKKHAYYLDDATADNLRQQARAGSELVERVLRHRLKDSGYLVDYNTAAEVLRKFLFECFARFGRQIAANVSGRTRAEDLAERPDVQRAFDAATAGLNLPAQAQSSLMTRCRTLLMSHDPDDEALKFQLTQSYYVAELLEIDGTRFNPLAEEAFAGAVFYLDTNVVLMYFLGNEEHTSLFDEMLRVGRRMGISLRVTRATVDELRRAAADHLSKIGEVVGVVPYRLLAERVRDDFLAAYQAEQEQSPDLTVQDFGQRFERLTETLEAHGIELDDRLEDEMIGDADVARLEEVLQRLALATRGYKKGEVVLRHDVAHYQAVADARHATPKVWFLTRDRLLVQAAVEVAGDELPFCFSIAAFVHALSPFSETASEDRSLADAFSVILSEQVVTPERLFDIDEINFLARHYEDIFVTPADQIIEALDVVKSTLLHGKSLLSADHETLSLEIRKRLASTDLDQRRAAEQQRAEAEAKIDRQAAAADVERQRRLAAESQVLALSGEKSALTVENVALAEARDKGSEDLQTERAERLREAQRRRLERAVGGAVLGVVIAGLAAVIGDVIARTYATVEPVKDLLIVAIRYTCVMLAFIAPVSYVRHAEWPLEWKVFLYGSALTVAFVVLDPFADSLLKPFSKYGSVALFVAMLVFGFLTYYRSRGQRRD